MARGRKCGLCDTTLTTEQGNICWACYKTRNLPAPEPPSDWPRCLLCGEAVEPGQWCLCPEIPF